MPRGRVETQLTVVDPNNYNTLAAGARYSGIITVTKTDSDTDLTVGMPVLYISSFNPAAGTEYDFHKLKDSYTGIFCAALYT